MLSAKWHRHIFLFGIIALASGMLFGTVPTSIPQGILGANWLLEKNFSYKWQQLKSNKLFWVLISFFLLHLLGLSYTENMTRGLEDIKNKLPLIVLPVIFFSTKPLDKKEFELLFGFFFLSVLVSSICCFIVYSGFTKKIIIDVRKASVFMSHIRFSLFIAFAIIGLTYYWFHKKSNTLRFISIAVILWLLFFMFKLEMATGFLCLFIVASILSVFYITKVFHKTISIAFIVILCVGFGLLVNAAVSSLNMFDKNPKNKANILLEKSINNNYYLQDTKYNLAENGNLVTINISGPELLKEWPKRSHISLEGGNDKKGNNLYYTLLRYMASKGLSKDSAGLSKLTKSDIKNIEKGISNYKYTNNSGLILRWRELVWEYTKYKRGENPSGHTLTMRLEFWKTAYYVIHQYPLFGVGTGDIQDSFNKAYVDTNSKLDLIWRLRCHNQYLAVTVAFGFVGLLLFLFYLLYPAISLRKKIHYLYWPFFLIALLSFVTEDTLETQSGVTFFIFFHTLFLWLASYKTETKYNV